jgi:hypothetical protein
MADRSFLNAQGITRRINTQRRLLPFLSFGLMSCEAAHILKALNLQADMRLLELRASSRSISWWYFTRLAGKAPADPLQTGLHISVHQPLEWRLQTNAFLQWRLVADWTDLEELDTPVLLLILPS